MAEVTILLAAYNGERFIEEQIQSVLNSDYEDFELRIYDDGSTDHTIEIIKKFVKDYPNRITFFQNEKNLGVTKNFLSALRSVTSKYAMFCDQDDVWLKDKITKTLAYMKKVEMDKSTKAGCVPTLIFTDALIVDEKLKLCNSSFHQSNHLNTKKLSLAELLIENKVIGCTSMMNQALIRMIANKPIPEKVRFHDWWVAIVAAAFGKIGYLNVGTINYRQHSSNVVGNQDFTGYVKHRLSQIKELKDQLQLPQHQALEFLRLYHNELGEKKRIVFVFSKLSKYSIIKRRYYCFKFGYFKSGLIRNIAVLLFI